ncbi:MAG: lysophospholipid acyltransferase family protein [Alphaproteobacteria bacterium]
MRKLRSALILLTFMIFTVPLMPVQLGLRLFAPRLARAFPHWYHRQLCRLLGVTIHCHGAVAENRPVLLVSNHISWLDIIVLGAVAPVSFVAKSEVGKWPFISWLAKLQGTLFINRENRLGAGHSAREIMARLRDGDHIVIFAEGTSSDGNSVLPFKTSLFAAAKPRGEDAHTLQHGIYVQSVAIAYTHQQGLALCRRGRPIVAWYGDMDIASHAWELFKRGPLDVSVRIGPPVELEAFKDRKELAQYTEAEVRRAVADFLFPRNSEQSGAAMDAGDDSD